MSSRGGKRKTSTVCPLPTDWYSRPTAERVVHNVSECGEITPSRGQKARCGVDACDEGYPLGICGIRSGWGRTVTGAPGKSLCDMGGGEGGGLEVATAE